MSQPEPVVLYGPRTQRTMEMSEVLTFAGIEVKSVNLRLEEALVDPPNKTWGMFVQNHAEGRNVIVLSDGAFFLQYKLLHQAAMWLQQPTKQLIVMEQEDPFSFSIARAAFDLAEAYHASRRLTVIRPRPTGDPNALGVHSTSAVLAFARAGWTPVTV